MSELHVGIIMDGNGRWAVSRGLPRTAGHRRGVNAVRRTIESAPGLGIGTLTLYAFSQDNWKRPRKEVGVLMRLFRAMLDSEVEELRRNGVRLVMIGRRDRIDPSLRDAVERAEARTAAGEGMLLRLAIDYSSRDAILAAARQLPRETSDPEALRAAFERSLSGGDGAGGAAPPVDLLIRTGGDQRLSDFLLWESAYAELLFLPVLWPDFTDGDLALAVETFAGRERRFGTVASRVRTLYSPAP